jgi:hypothetical protein
MSILKYVQWKIDILLKEIEKYIRKMKKYKSLW